MLYDAEHRQTDISTLSEEDIQNNPYIKELNSFAEHCEYSNNTLLLVYKTEEQLNKAKQICNVRNISYYPKTHYNKSYRGYCFDILCWANTLNPYKLDRYREQKLN